MFWKQLFAKKSLETLFQEMAGENRLRRVLGPISLTSLGVGAIIGAGIFVMTGRAAAQLAGPGIVLSYCVAGLGCLFAALCYAEFAAAVPVAGSAYTYAYATLGEVFAWIIGWDLVLEYAMACSTVASGWTHYLNELLKNLFNYTLPGVITNPTFGAESGWLNLPAVLIMVIVTAVLVIGIRESATMNAVLVMVKLGVVLFVIVLGWGYIDSANWTKIPVADRLTAEETLIPDKAKDFAKEKEHLSGDDLDSRVVALDKFAVATYRIDHKREVNQELSKEGKISQTEADAALAKVSAEWAPKLPTSEVDKKAVTEILADAKKAAPAKITESWGLLSYLGINTALVKVDDSIRSPFIPYGFSGIMLGAAIIFFAYIGFDSISTHSEEAKKPQRDVPFGIIASLLICTVLYILVSLVISGMEPYPDIDTKAAVAAAFRHKADAALAAGQPDGMLRAAGVLISIGALAGLTSVLLITFLSQARIFLAMARDGLLPHSIFGVVHPRFRTPHRSTILTGILICLVAALFSTDELENMVNIGTLMAFVFVCAAVLMLRIKRPDAHRPFRAPFIYVVAPLGIAVNLFMTLFLPLETWLRLVIWLFLGLILYFCYGFRHSVSAKNLTNQLALEGASPSNAPFDSVDKDKDERYGGARPMTPSESIPLPTPHEGPSTGEPAPVGFQQRLGLFDATMLVAGTMIGSGIFLVSSDIAQEVGAPAWLMAVWVLTGIMTIIGALSYAELAAMMPHAGGQYVFLREAYSPLWGFLYGWTSFLVIQTGTIAAVAIAFAKFLGVLVPRLGTGNVLTKIDVPWNHKGLEISAGQFVAVGIIVLLTLLNTRGVREGKWVQNLFTISKTLALILLIVLGFTIARNPHALEANLADPWGGSEETPAFRAVFDTTGRSLTNSPTLLALWASLATLMVAGGAMVGSLFSADAWNNVTFTAGEVRNPRRNLPLSLALGVGLVIVLYILANCAYLATLPAMGDAELARRLAVEAKAAKTPEEKAAAETQYDVNAERLGISYAHERRVATASLQQAGISWAVPFMAIAIMVSTFGCVNGLILMGARLYYTMAKDGLFFQAVGRLNRQAVPMAGLLCQGVWAILLVFSGTYGDLLDYVIFAALLFYVLTVVGLFVLRRTRPGLDRPYKAFGYPVIPGLYVLLCALIMVDLLVVKPMYTWPGLIIVVAGIPVYFLWRMLGKKASGTA